MKEIKPICYGCYTEVDRGFRRCYVCKYQYSCKRKTKREKGITYIKSTGPRLIEEEKQ